MSRFQYIGSLVKQFYVSHLDPRHIDHRQLPDFLSRDLSTVAEPSFYAYALVRNQICDDLCLREGWWTRNACLRINRRVIVIFIIVNPIDRLVNGS